MLELCCDWESFNNLPINNGFIVRQQILIPHYLGVIIFQLIMTGGVVFLWFVMTGGSYYFWTVNVHRYTGVFVKKLLFKIFRNSRQNTIYCVKYARIQVFVEDVCEDDKASSSGIGIGNRNKIQKILLNIKVFWEQTLIHSL